MDAWRFFSLPLPLLILLLLLLSFFFFLSSSSSSSTSCSFAASRCRYLLQIDLMLPSGWLILYQFLECFDWLLSSHSTLISKSNGSLGETRELKKSQKVRAKKRRAFKPTNVCRVVQLSRQWVALVAPPSPNCTKLASTALLQLLNPLDRNGTLPAWWCRLLCALRSQCVCLHWLGSQPLESC